MKLHKTVFQINHRVGTLNCAIKKNYPHFPNSKGTVVIVSILSLDILIMLIYDIRWGWAVISGILLCSHKFDVSIVHGSSKILLVG